MPEISGLVQRLKWAPESKAVFVYVGPTPTFTRLLLIHFDTDDPSERAARQAFAQFLVRARTAGITVTVFFDQDSLVTGVDTWLSQIRTEAIEVTQAIQNLHHSVTLIAQKRTVVRVYLSSKLTPPITVSGELRLRRSSTGPTVTIPSLNTVLLDASQFGQLDAQRMDLQRSLNFVLPADQIGAGPLEIEFYRLTNVDTGASLDAGPRSPVIANFINSPLLRLRILGIGYMSGTPPVFQTPSTLDFALVVSWLRRAYPVAEILHTQAIVQATNTAPFTCGNVNTQVIAIRALDMDNGGDNRTHYYGLVSDAGFFMRGCAEVPGTPNPAAVGSGPTGPNSWGWDFDGSYGDWYTGHELGHTFGRHHPGFCGESSNDPAYPFDGGQLSDADNAYVGFDVGDAAQGLPMQPLPGTQWHDVMTYCNRQWLSSYTYMGIRARLVAEDGLGASAGPSPAFAGRPDERFPDEGDPQRVQRSFADRISVVATVNLNTRDGKIDYVHPLSRGELTPQEGDSAVVLRVIRADGELIYESTVPVMPLSDLAEGEQIGLVDAVVASGPDARIIELLIDGKPVDTFRASEAPPDVRAVSRPSSERLAWQSRADEESRHTYTIMASTDKGRTWQTLAVGLKSTNAAVDFRQFRGAEEVLIRIIATDGFRTSEVVEPFIPNDFRQE